MKNEAAAPLGAYTIPSFCGAHGISRAHLYRLWKEGKGPRTMQIGTRRLISVEAAADWRRVMEGEQAA